MMKNIFIVSKADIVYGNTAAATRMNNYAKALSNKNKIYMLSFDKLLDSSEFIEAKKNIFTIQENKKDNIKIYDIISTIKAVVKFNKLYNGICGDKYIIYYPNTNTILFDIILLLLYRKNLFAEINEVRKFSSEGQTRLVSKIRLYLYSLIYESTLKFYKGVIYISMNIKLYYKEMNNNNLVIPILSDFNSINTYKKEHVIGNEGLLFLFTGTVSFAKENLEELIFGFKLFTEKYNNSKLYFYGSITDNNKKKLLHIISDLDLSDKVKYKGNLDRNDIKYILAKADCLLLPRNNNKQNYYGFSTKLAEYAISGTPIILTNTGVIGDYFKDKENCLLCEGYNRQSFKDKFIEFVSLDKNEKIRLSSNALETARLHFDYRNYSDILDEFIQ